MERGLHGCGLHQTLWAVPWMIVSWDLSPRRGSPPLSLEFCLLLEAGVMTTGQIPTGTGHPSIGNKSHKCITSGKTLSDQQEQGWDQQEDEYTGYANM